ncbi:hypothetical protein IFM89_010408 [Coptis chinensis]|uniref:Uncharacterized protein n=1 Tax=Coptis chinensis TaxID=261450 RepID=A0A835H2E3_9MAGN|nr:hypothetical protein IFM89_010408 [Coptis chinensis]
MSCFNKDEDENNRKYYSCKKSNRQLEKKTGEDKRTKEVKEQGSVSMGRSTASSVLSGTIAKTWLLAFRYSVPKRLATTQTAPTAATWLQKDIYKTRRSVKDIRETKAPSDVCPF